MTDEWRGWLQKTVNDGINWNWKALTFFDSDGDYFYPISHTYTYTHDTAHLELTNQSNCLGASDDAFMRANYVYDKGNGWSGNEHVFDLGVSVTTDANGTIQVRAKAPFTDGYANDVWNVGAQILVSNTTSDPTAGGWTGVEVILWSGGDGTAEWRGSADNAASLTFRWIRLVGASNYEAGPTNKDGGIDAIRVSNATAASNQSRPIGLEVDSEDSSRIYVTMWDGTNLALWVYDSDLARQRTYSLGAATAQQVADKDYYCEPFSPHRFDLGSGFGNRVYVYGRMAGSIPHIGLSTDAGATFSDAGWAAWDSAARVVCLFGDEHNAPGTLWAALTNNNGADELWRGVGANWQKVADLPATPQAAYRAPGGVPNHPVAAILGGQVYYSDDSDGYASWSLLTNQPGTLGAGTIIWIV